MFPPPKHHLQERRTSAQDQEAGEARDQEVDHNSHPTLGPSIVAFVYWAHAAFCIAVIGLQFTSFV